jgi:hypothetical protein
LQTQWEAHGSYTVTSTRVGEFMVTLNPAALAAAKTRDGKARRIGPTYYRTRVVSTHSTRSGDKLFLKCTCGMYERCLIPCRHIAAVKNGFFDFEDDVHPMHLIVYNTTPGSSLARVQFNSGTADGPSIRGLDPTPLAAIEAACMFAGKYDANELTFSPPPAAEMVPGVEDCPEESDADVGQRNARRRKTRYTEYLELWNLLGRNLAQVAGLPTAIDAEEVWEADLQDLREFANVM